MRGCPRGDRSRRRTRRPRRTGPRRRTRKTEAGRARAWLGKLPERPAREPLLRPRRRRLAVGAGQVAERAERGALLGADRGRLRLADARLLRGELLALGVAMELGRGARLALGHVLLL